MRLRKTSGLCLAAALFSTVALADSLVQTATLKDLQTVGSTSKKQKHQQYDLVIDTSTNEYICRTKLGSSLKPTQFVVGSSLQFKLNGQNGEATTSDGKKTKCGIVRVAATPYGRSSEKIRLPCGRLTDRETPAFGPEHDSAGHGELPQGLKAESVCRISTAVPASRTAQPVLPVSISTPAPAAAAGGSESTCCQVSIEP